MKLLLENWRKHLKEESTLPTEGSAEAAATYYAHVAGAHGMTDVEEYEAADDAAAIAKAEEEFGEDNQDNLKLLKISKLVKDFPEPPAAAPPAGPEVAPEKEKARSISDIFTGDPEE